MKSSRGSLDIDGRYAPDRYRGTKERLGAVRHGVVPDRGARTRIVTVGFWGWLLVLSFRCSACDGTDSITVGTEDWR